MKQILRMVVTGILLGLTAQQAHAFDLTGTWQGTQVCKRTTVDGTDKQVFEEDVLTITQSGSEVRLYMASVKFLYTGLALANVANPSKGAVALRLCGLSANTATEGEMVNARVRTPPAPQASTFVATSTYADEHEVDTCQWNYKRTLTEDPGVAACP